MPLLLCDEDAGVEAAGLIMPLLLSWLKGNIVGLLKEFIQGDGDQGLRRIGKGRVCLHIVGYASFISFFAVFISESNPLVFRVSQGNGEASSFALIFSGFLAATLLFHSFVESREGFLKSIFSSWLYGTVGLAGFLLFLIDFLASENEVFFGISAAMLGFCMGGGLLSWISGLRQGYTAEQAILITVLGTMLSAAANIIIFSIPDRTTFMVGFVILGVMQFGSLAYLSADSNNASIRQSDWPEASISVMKEFVSANWQSLICIAMIGFARTLFLSFLLVALIRIPYRLFWD